MGIIPPVDQDNLSYAEVAELVDAVDSKSTAGNSVGVQVPPSAPITLFSYIYLHPLKHTSGLNATEFGVQHYSVPYFHQKTPFVQA